MIFSPTFENLFIGGHLIFVFYVLTILFKLIRSQYTSSYILTYRALVDRKLSFIDHK